VWHRAGVLVSGQPGGSAGLRGADEAAGDLPV